MLTVPDTEGRKDEFKYTICLGSSLPMFTFWPADPEILFRLVMRAACA